MVGIEKFIDQVTTETLTVACQYPGVRGDFEGSLIRWQISDRELLGKLLDRIQYSCKRFDTSRCICTVYSGIDKTTWLHPADDLASYLGGGGIHRKFTLQTAMH